MSSTSARCATAKSKSIDEFEGGASMTAVTVYGVSLNVSKDNALRSRHATGSIRRSSRVVRVRPTTSAAPKYFSAIGRVSTIEPGRSSAVVRSPWSAVKPLNTRKNSALARTPFSSWNMASSDATSTSPTSARLAAASTSGMLLRSRCGRAAGSDGLRSLSAPLSIMTRMTRSAVGWKRS